MLALFNKSVKSTQLNSSKVVSVDSFLSLMCVILGVVIPISTSLTSVAVIIILPLCILSNINSNSKYFALRITLPIMLFIFLNIIFIFNSFSTLNDSLSTLLKMSRLLLIPIFAVTFSNSNRRRKLALTGFISSIVLYNIMYICVLFIKCKATEILIFDYILIKFPFKDRIFTSTIFAWNLYACFILFFNSKKSYYSLIYLLMIFIGFCSIFYINNGMTGQFIAFLLIMFVMFFYRKKAIYLVLSFSLILSMLYPLFIINHPLSRWKLAIMEVNIALNNKYSSKYTNTDISIKSVKSNLPGTHSESVSERIRFVRGSMKIIKDSLLFGWGTGSFRNVYKKYFPNNSISNPHNQYVFTAVELGIVGLLVLAYVFVSIFISILKLPIIERQIAIGMFVTFLIGSAANSWLIDFTSMHLFVFVMGLSLSSSFQKETSTLSNITSKKIGVK